MTEKPVNYDLTRLEVTLKHCNFFIFLVSQDFAKAIKDASDQEHDGLEMQLKYAKGKDTALFILPDAGEEDIDLFLSHLKEANIVFSERVRNPEDLSRIVEMMKDELGFHGTVSGMSKDFWVAV